MKQSLAFFHDAFDAAPVGMIIVDASGAIVDLNQQLEKLMGYGREELLGQPIELLVDGVGASHRAHRERYFAQPATRPMGAGRDLYGRHRDGHRVPVEIGLTPVKTVDGTYVLASVVDLTERKRAEQLLQASLTEKEVLLKELHHRAKNNLQLIASLLDLASTTPGPDVLAECRDRINSIAMVHEKLYQSGTFARIALDDYLRSLGEQVAHGWPRPEVSVRIEAVDISLPLDTAIPCGLVINELLTNAYKHAFPGQRAGTIVVNAGRSGSCVVLSVSDDGVGFPSGGLQRQGHIGLELVHALARQLRGTLDFNAGQGARVTLTFEGAVS